MTAMRACLGEGFFPPLSDDDLKHFYLKIIGEDVGGRTGRKARFHLDNGRLQGALLPSMGTMWPK